MFNITMFAANETSIVELETRKNQFCAPLVNTGIKTGQSPV